MIIGYWPQVKEYKSNHKATRMYTNKMAKLFLLSILLVAAIGKLSAFPYASQDRMTGALEDFQPPSENEMAVAMEEFPALSENEMARAMEEFPSQLENDMAIVREDSPSENEEAKRSDVGFPNQSDNDEDVATTDNAMISQAG